MAKIDWSVLSGPRVSRRTLLAVAAASGATGYAGMLQAMGAAPVTRPGAARRPAQGEPKPGGTLKLGYGISQIPNLDPAKDMHMHEGTLTFVDDDHIEVGGVAWVNGKPAEDHCGTMKLVRKK